MFVNETKLWNAGYVHVYHQMDYVTKTWFASFNCGKTLTAEENISGKVSVKPKIRAENFPLCEDKHHLGHT